MASVVNVEGPSEAPARDGDSSGPEITRVRSNTSDGEGVTISMSNVGLDAMRYLLGVHSGERPDNSRAELSAHTPEFRTFTNENATGNATLEESVDVGSTVWSSTGVMGDFHDLSVGRFWLWKLRILLSVAVTIGVFWWSDGGLRTATAIATATFASITTVLFVVNELGLQLILRDKGATSSVSAPTRGSQERLFEWASARGSCATLQQVIFLPYHAVRVLVDGLIVRMIGQRVMGWVVNTGCVNIGGVIAVGPVARYQEYWDYGTGLMVGNCSWIDGMKRPAYGRLTERKTLFIKYDSFKHLLEDLGATECWVVYGYHRALRMATSDGPITIQLHSRHNKTIFGVIVSAKPGVAVRVKMTTLSNLAYEVVMCDNCYAENASASPLLSHTLQSGLPFRPVLTDISEVRWLRGPGQFVSPNVLDALGVCGPALGMVEWQRCLSYNSAEWPTEWAVGLTAGKAGRVDVIIGENLATVGNCGGELPVAIVAGDEAEGQTLQADYSLVFTIESRGTYKSVVKSTIGDPFREARCYKPLLPNVRGRTALLPYGPPGLWHYNNGAMTGLSAEHPLSLLGDGCGPPEPWANQATDEVIEKLH